MINCNGLLHKPAYGYDKISQIELQTTSNLDEVKSVSFWPCKTLSHFFLLEIKPEHSYIYIDLQSYMILKPSLPLKKNFAPGTYALPDLIHHTATCIKHLSL